MELLITTILKSLLLPPGTFLLLLLLGVVLLRLRPLVAKVLLWSGLLLTYLFSTPYVEGIVMRYVQRYSAIEPDHIEEQVKSSNAGAIVVLSSSSYKNAPEYGHDTVGGDTLERIRYGAYLYRNTALPLVVSGGHVLDTTGDTLAAEMAESLQNDFGVKDVWLEDRSHTTAENAFFTARLLKTKGIDTVLLVTHAYHMQRAVRIFEKSGLKVIPAPTALSVQRQSNVPPIMLWLPSASALYGSCLALHELVGMVWYAMRY
jgi:uncharacterized SAM-binding protein YcdF (DUF218 family)